MSRSQNGWVRGEGRGSTDVYRGRDRRGTLGESTSLLAPMGAIAIGLMSAVAFAAFRPLADFEGSLGVLAQAWSFGLLGVVAMLAAIRWRWFGDARAAYLMVGCASLSCMYGFGIVIAPLLPGWVVAHTLALVAAAAAVAVIAVFGALQSLEVDAALRTWVIAILPVGVFLAALLLSTRLIGLGSPPAAMEVIGWTLVLVGAYAVHRSVSLRSPFVGWVGSAFVIKGLHEQHIYDQGMAATAGLLAETIALSVCVIGAFVTCRRTFSANEARAKRARHEYQRQETYDREAKRAAEGRMHELRNALLAIEGATNMIAERPWEKADPTGDLARAVRQECGRLRTLIESTENAQALPVRFDVRPVLEQQVLLAGVLGWDVAAVLPRHPVEVFTDPHEFAEIIQNLLGNAAVHAAGSGPIDLGVDRTESGVEVWVVDRGPGIPAELRDRLLTEPVPSQSGSGIGLHLCADLAASRGAQLTLTDHDGGGTVARLSFPRRPKPLDRVSLSTEDGPPNSVATAAAPAVRGAG